MEQVKIELMIPRVVDEFWRSLGFDESNYQECFFDCLRAQIDSVASDAPKAKEVLKFLEQASQV